MTQRSFTAVSESAGQVLDTLRVLVGREFRIRYKGSFFGILWAILTPLGTVLVLEFVFGRILDMRVPNFAAFIYSGLLPWVWFSTAAQTGATTLVQNRDLVRTPFFSKSLLPAIVTCTNFLLYLFALPVLIVLLLGEGLPVTSAVLALPVIWMVQGLLTFAVATLVAASGVVIRDVPHLMGVLLLFWFYLTPIFYSLEQVPPELSGWLLLNPMAPIVSAHRAVTLYGRSPDWVQLGYSAGMAAGLLVLSVIIFRTLEDAFVDEA